ncbi:MAG: hypothetical protein HY976_03280 [Candidatus Kerfeldbacteria bacterium]|nr:hypothetical protein [Candidatus Kerfeldbacteria bacterium]
MQRSTIIIIFVLVAVGAAVGGYVLYRDNLSKETPNVNLPVVAGNTNDSSVSTPPIVKGDIDVNQSTTYREVTFAIDTALKADAYRRTKAPAGSTFLVLFLKPFVAMPSGDPISWVSSDVRLAADGGATYRPLEISLPASAGVSGGYLWFQVPIDAKGFKLEFGTGGTKQVLDLDI